MRAGVAASRKLKPKPPDQNSEAINKLKQASRTNGQRTVRREKRPTSQLTKTRTNLSVPNSQIKEASLPLSEAGFKKHLSREEIEKETLLPKRSPSSLYSTDISSSERKNLSGVISSDAITPDTLNKGLSNGRAFSQFSDEFSDKPRRAHTLVNVATSVVAAGAKASRNENLVATRKMYYRKAIGLMVGGGLIFAVGITVAALYFAGYKTFQMIGPICLSVGLLLGVCGLVWIPIINTKLKRKQQMMARTFSL